MAQKIMKMQSGNKFGRYFNNGKEYVVDEALLKRLEAGDSDAAAALRAGKDVSYEPGAYNGLGALTGVDNYSTLNERQNRRMHKEPGLFEGNRMRQARHQVDFHRNLDLSGTKLVGSNEEPINRQGLDMSRWLELEYLDNEDGTKSLSSSANNNFIKQRIEKYLSGLDGYDEYKLSDAFGTDKDKASQYIESVREKLNQDFWNRYNAGSLSKDDISILNSLNIRLKGASASDTESATTRSYTNAGLDPAKASPYVTVGNNGELTVTDAFNNIFGTGNGIYNQDWINYLSKQGKWNPDYQWLQGYTRLGNHLYRTSDLNNPESTLYQFIHNPGGFYDLNAANNFKGANELLEYLWGTSDDYNTFDKNNFYSNWSLTQDPTFRYRSLNGILNAPEGTQIVEYWSGDERDEFGRPNEYKYALLDANGNFLEDIDINAYERNLNGAQTPLSFSEIINDPTQKDYHGRIVQNFTDNDRNIAYSLYRNPNNPNDVILYSNYFDQYRPGLFGGTTKLANQNFRIPESLIPYLNNRFLTNLATDREASEQFTRSLWDLINSGWQEHRVSADIFETGILSIDKLKELGFSESEAQELRKKLIQLGDRSNYNEGEKSAGARQKRYLAPRYIVPTQVASHQKGGTIRTTVEDKGKQSDVTVEKIADTTKATNNLSDLTSADKLQLASIAGDVASLLAAIPTGGNPFAAGLGATSTLAQFGADIKRDGLDAGDIGQLILGLGLDAATLLPGVGIAGKSLKTVKTLKRSFEVIKRGLLAAGAANSVRGLTNIVNGNGTLDDWKALSTGLMAIKGIKNEVQNIRATQYKGRSTPAETPKSKEQIRREVIQKEVDNFENGRLKTLGDDVPRWVDKNTGKIKDTKEAFDEAAQVLKTEAKINVDSKVSDAMRSVKATTDKATSSVKNAFSGSYNPFSSNFRYSMTNRILPNNFDLRSIFGNTSKLRTLGRVATNNEEIANQLLQQNWDLGPGYGGNWFYRSPAFRRPIYRTPLPTTMALPTSSGRVYATTRMNNQPIPYNLSRNPVEITPLGGNLVNVDGNIGIKFHKKGGKIIKGQNSLDTDDIKFSGAIEPVEIVAPKIDRKPYAGLGLSPIPRSLSELPTSSEMLGKSLQNIATKPYTGTYQTNTQYLESLAPKLETKINTTPTVSEIKSSTSNKPLTASTTTPSIGPGQPFNWDQLNLAKRLTDLTSVVGGLSANDRAARLTAQGIKHGFLGRLKQYGQEFYDKFTDNGLVRLYDDRIDQMRDYKSVSNDRNTVMAERLMRDMKVDELMGERNLQLSQMIDSHNLRLQQLRAAYANQRKETADYNREVEGNMNMTLKDNKAKLVQANWLGVLNPALNQVRQDITLDQNERTQAKVAQQGLQDYHDSRVEVDKALGMWKSKWASEKARIDSMPAGSAKTAALATFASEYGDSADSYAAKMTSNGQQSLMDQIKMRSALAGYNFGVGRALYRTPLYDKPLDFSMLYSSTTPISTVRTGTHGWSIMKQGGAIKRRTYNEQAILDDSKDARRAISKMNDNLLKMLLKLLS